MASRNPIDLHPDLRPIYFSWLNTINRLGFTVLIVCTYRSPAEQLELFKQHKSQLEKGPHNFTLANGTPASKAFDFALVLNGKLCWDTTIDSNHNNYPDYKELGEIGKKLGLEWGGDWKTLKDCDHLQLRGA